MANKTTMTVSTFPLVLLLVILKLSGAVNISWLWVFSPIWIPFGVFVILAILFGIFALVFGLKINRKG